MNLGPWAVMLLICTNLAVSQTPASAASEHAVRQTIDRYISAMRRGDRDAVLALARPDSARFSSGGTRLGRLLSRAPRRDMSKISYFVRHVEFLRPDAALAIGLWRDTTVGALYPSGAFNYALVEEDGSWKFASVQETLTQALPKLETSVDPSPITRNGDWEILFDGKKTEHWLTMSGARDLGGAWRVADGCLISVPNGLSADLRSDREYTSFELKWDWMGAERSNSGVKYRLFALDAITFGVTRFATGWEYQMADDAGDPGARIDDSQKSGALYGVAPVFKPAAKRAGELIESRLFVADDHVEHWLNVVMTALYPVDVPFASPLSLQHHRSEVRFRNIRVRRSGLP